MGITYKSSFSAIKRLKQLTSLHEERLGKAMEYEAGRIVARTNQGQGANGPLDKYSDKKYFDKDGKRIEFITKKGKVRPLETYREYKIRTKGKDLVNLTETGSMLRGMQSKTELNERGVLGKIFFKPTEEKKARWNQELRPNFFKLAKEQLNNIVKQLRGK